MEYLEEHNELRRTNINETPNQQIIKSNKIELTPNANRKNSDFIINEMKTELSSVMNKHSRGVLIIGICGGQSSGKSMISAYLKKHLTNSYIISEKDFFIGNKERRKSITDDKLKFIDLHNDDDGYSNLRKQRLVETNSIKCFDLDSMYIAIKNIKEGKVTKIQSWDKDKYVM